MFGISPMTFFMAINLLSLATETKGARIFLRPLSADQVYRELRDSGREDAVPEGRIITQGISAIAGFTLGFAKGIGGAILVNALAGAGMSFASLAGQGANSNANTGGGGGGTTMQMQEICFNSRSLAESDDEDDWGTERQAVTDTGTIGTTAATSPTTTGTLDTPTGTSTATGGGGGTTNCIVVQKPTSG